jgi:hypothetical protein
LAGEETGPPAYRFPRKKEHPPEKPWEKSLWDIAEAKGPFRLGQGERSGWSTCIAAHLEEPPAGRGSFNSEPPHKRDNLVQCNRMHCWISESTLDFNLLRMTGDPKYERWIIKTLRWKNLKGMACMVHYALFMHT